MVAALPLATFERLKPHAIDIRVNIDPVHWFLSPAKDTRSSLYLTLSIHSFRGAQEAENSRTDVKKPERRQYLKNASLVLLTWARQGMVIFVPQGAKRDKTQKPDFYEGVYDYLSGMGVAEV